MHILPTFSVVWLVAMTAVFFKNLKYLFLLSPGLFIAFDLCNSMLFTSAVFAIYKYSMPLNLWMDVKVNGEGHGSVSSYFFTLIIVFFLL